MAQACGAAFAAAAWGYGDAVSVIAPGGTHTAPDCAVLHSTAEIVNLVMASGVADPL